MFVCLQVNLTKYFASLNMPASCLVLDKEEDRSNKDQLNQRTTSGGPTLFILGSLSLRWVGNARGFRSVAATVTANVKVIRQLSSPPIDKTIITDRLRQSEWMIELI